MIDQLLSLALVIVVGWLCWHIGSARARRAGNENLLAYARGAGDMISSFGNSLPDPRPLKDQIQDYILAHGYSITFGDNVALVKRPDGTRAFTLNMTKPTFLPDLDWPEMLMRMVAYQLHKDKSGQYVTSSVIPIPREAKTTGFTAEEWTPERKRAKAHGVPLETLE